MTPDQMINCADCNQEFVYSEQEQQLFAERGFTNPPKRCLECRKKRRANRRPPGGGGGGGRGGPRRGGGGGGGGFGGPPRGDRPKFNITCNACGRDATVPFKPTPGKSVFCPDCYKQRKGSTMG